MTSSKFNNGTLPQCPPSLNVLSTCLFCSYWLNRMTYIAQPMVDILSIIRVPTLWEHYFVIKYSTLQVLHNFKLCLSHLLQRIKALYVFITKWNSAPRFFDTMAFKIFNFRIYAFLRFLRFVNSVEDKIESFRSLCYFLLVLSKT